MQPRSQGPWDVKRRDPGNEDVTQTAIDEVGVHPVRQSVSPYEQTCISLVLSPSFGPSICKSFKHQATKQGVH